MMLMMNITRSKSQSASEFERGPLGQGWGLLRSTLTAGPTPHHPRARVTATAKLFQRDGLQFSFRFAGVFPLCS
jgi:hypothetical protein